ncbi:6363_t:CDS:2, partial [Gigaspora rosea]
VVHESASSASVAEEALVNILQSNFPIFQEWVELKDSLAQNRNREFIYINEDNESDSENNSDDKDDNNGSDDDN